tara:strand:+ start:455 stop:757 length:303 start_codon:yes stop_codon:yes gene_type:complete
MKSQRFQNLVSKNPNNELFRFSLGQAFFEEASFKEAITAFDFCLDAKPDWMMAAILKGKSLLALKQLDDAKTTLQIALEMAVSQHHEAPEADIRKLLAAL